MSDRVPIYYEYAEKALRQGFAFVCTCEPDQFKRIIESGRACPHRSKSPTENLELWHNMLSGGLKEGEAVVRVKTETTHPNPAVRDWPAFRIIDPEKYPHPRVGSKYRVWPLYNFSAAVDDHLMGVTHIIRGKEHLTNAVRQTFLYKHMGWSYPEAFEAHLPLHPELPSLGNRTLKVVPREGIARIWLSGTDLQVFEKAKVVRLMELFNVEIHSTKPDLVKATFHSQEYAKARELKAPLIQWVPDDQHISCEVVMPDATRTRGFGETNLIGEKAGSIIQMVRFGFGRIDY